MATVHSKTRLISVMATVLWVGFMFYVTGAITKLPEVSNLGFDAVEPMAHYGTHLVLAAMIYVIARPRTSKQALRIRALGIAIGGTVAIGLGLEGLQLFLPGRSVEVSDVLFGAFGATIGACAAFLREQLGARRGFFLAATASVVVMAIAFGFHGEFQTALRQISYPKGH